MIYMDIIQIFQQGLILLYVQSVIVNLLEIKVLITKIRKSIKKQLHNNQPLQMHLHLIQILSNTPFRFKLVIKTPDSTKLAKAITLEKKPNDYYKFDDLILQKVSEVVGLLVHNDYELSYKAEKGTGAITFLEEEEDFDEFIREHNRLTSSDKVLLVFVTIQKHEAEKKKKVFMFKFIYLLLII